MDDDKKLKEGSLMVLQQDVHLEFTDRSELVDILTELARETADLLSKDCVENHRYARQMEILNDFHLIDGERIPTKLPYYATSWNDLDEEEILLSLLTAVEDYDEKHVWNAPRIRLAGFIGEATKRHMDQLDREEEERIQLYEEGDIEYPKDCKDYLPAGATYGIRRFYR